LYPSLQIAWDNKANSNILVGSTLNETMLVANPEELQDVLTQLEDKVVMKVCVISMGFDRLLA
jgi:hypothetical protein